MDKRLALELAKARQHVRRKIRGLQTDLDIAHQEITQRLQPLTQPLQTFLLTNVKKEEPVTLKQETPPAVKRRIRRLQYRPITSTPRAPKQERRVDPIASSTLLDVSYDDPEAPGAEEVLEYVPEDASSSVSIPSMTDIKADLQTLVNSPAYTEFLDQWTGLAKQYIGDMIADTEDQYDHLYGVRHNPQSGKFFIGNSEIDFQKDNKIIVQGITYEGTPGLFELLFKKKPVGYTKQDQAQYLDIVNRTNANRRHYKSDTQITGNNGFKYQTILKRPLPPATQRPRSGSLPTSAKRGGVLRTLDFTNQAVEYIPWTDVNQLVRRLQKLVASKEAGNNSHNNEITHIVNQLREQKFIY